MKTKFALFVLLNILPLSLVLAAGKSDFYYDSLVKSQNEKIHQLNKEISILKDYRSYDIRDLNSQINEIKNLDLPWSIRFIPILVPILAFLLTFGLGIITFIGFFKTKDALDKVEKAGDKIDKFRDNSQRIYEQYETRLKDGITEFEILEKETTKNIQKLYSSLKNNSMEIIQIEKSLSSHQTYIKQSIELSFDILIWYANKSKDKELLKSVFINRAVSNLYSFDEKERFSGISTLGEIGTLSEIIHLENVLMNNFENNINKTLAHQSIVNIKTRP